MKNTLCSLCTSPIKTETEKLCEECSKMEQQINFLIYNHTQAIKKYLGEKYNKITDTTSKDRRTNESHLPWGKHTPDRRKKIRRLEEKCDATKKRSSDF